MRHILIILLGLFLIKSCVDDANAAELPITAKAWLVADDRGKVIEGFNTTEVRSIASITKLLTVMTVLDANQSPDEVIYRTYTRQQMMNMALVKSDNNAATILCQQYPEGYYECLHQMNRKAQELEMLDTRIYDATGLIFLPGRSGEKNRWPNYEYYEQ